MTSLDMTRSEYILKRLLLLQKMEAPTISDAKKNFGEEFAEKLFCNCDPNFREDFGLEPPLKGPIGGDLWTSPSDLLIGKVCLKPPLTSKHIRALTHQGIMDIGMKIEKLFWNQIEIEKSKEMEDQDRMMRMLCEVSKKEAIAEVRAKMLEVFGRQRLELINEMDELCKHEMREMEMKFYLDLQDELKEQALYLEQNYQAKLKEEISKKTEIMSVKSSGDMQAREECMKKSFQCLLQKAEIQARFEIKKEYMRCRENLKSLQHELECKNLANLMYVICMERKKCTSEKNTFESQLKQEMQELNNTLISRDEEIAKIKAERDKHKKEIELRERALLEIIREFQKFINFALKAVPKQAEYLLSAEKLMVFELTDALSKLPQSKDDDHDRNFLWDKTPDVSDSSEVSLKVKDGHDCLKQPEISESELSTGQFLPGFYYNDQLFVREDFRNMISQGITIDENDMLWTKHVQDVMDHLKQPCQSCVFNEKKDTDSYRNVEKKKSILSYQSSVHFSLKERDPSDRDKKTRRTSLKPCEPEGILQTIDFSNIGSEEHRKTLLSAKNSLEILKENITRRKSSVKSQEFNTIKNEELNKMKPKQEELNKTFTLDSLSEESEIPQTVGSKLHLEARDSIIKAKVQHALDTHSDAPAEMIHEVGPVQMSSKLMMTMDSLEIIKQHESILPAKPKKEDIKDGTILESKISSEETVTKITDIHEPKEFDWDSDVNPRRTSIAFTGRSVIYRKEDLVFDGDIDSKKEKKGPAKSTKIKSKKSYKTSNRKSKPAPLKREYKKSQEIEERPIKVIMGDSSMNFYTQSNGQFTSDRIASFVNILKEYPNLIRLFTSVTR